jgi:HK97 family phage prohead protease
MRLSATAPLKFKFAAPDAAGEFSGIAATWDIDRVADRFQRGCFSNTLKSWRDRKALPPLLWGHIQTEPIGALVDAQETERGLEVVGRLALSTPNGKRAHDLLKTGSGALGLSVGFSVLDEDFDAAQGVNLIRDVDWMELSLTPTPCQPGAVVETVKTLYPTRKDFERSVRNALGLSAGQAKRLAAGGWGALARDEEERAAIDLDAIARQLQTITATLRG